MAASLTLLALAATVLAPALGSHIATHWMVTENGLVQPRDFSPYELVRPYDLLGFLNQDTMRHEIIQSYHDLVTRQTMLTEQWAALQDATDARTIMVTDLNCVGAGETEELSLYPPVLDSIRRGEITEKDLALSEYSLSEGEPPDCDKFSDLPFSMFTFEHLEGMVNRHNLSMGADLDLPEVLFPANTIRGFGRQVTQHLRKNNTSWLHYALASGYWKVQGNAYKAMQCSRRAVYHAPRRFKDIALLSMGSVFMRCNKKPEAQILFSAAVDHAPQYGVNHFALGNAFVMQGDLNSSVACYDRCIEAEPVFHEVHRLRHLMICHQKLMRQLGKVKDYLNRTRVNLSEYREREFGWWKQQALFLNSMKRESLRFSDLSRTSMDSICQAMDAVFDLDFCSLKKKGDRSSLIEVLLDGSNFPEVVFEPFLPLNAVWTLHTFVKNIEKQMNEIHSLVTKSEHLKAKDGKITSEATIMNDIAKIVPSIQKLEQYSNYMSAAEKSPSHEGALAGASQAVKSERKDSADKKTSEFPEFEGGTVLYPPTYKVNRYREDFDTADQWPTMEMCEEWADKVPAQLDIVYPMFLPFENKGILLKSLLSEKIGLTLDEEHPLPWHPPVCREIKRSTTTTPAFPRLPKSQQNSEQLPVGHLHTLLWNYVSDGRAHLVKNMHEAEIGQRILTAYKKKAAPKWILYTLSSLYWRVRHNNANALVCLASANKLVPDKYKDIIHTSLASVLLEVGYVEEALNVATQAFRLSLHEPSTNFLMSLIHMVKKNSMAHLFHMRQVVRVEPQYMDGLARQLLYGWSCKLLRMNTLESEKDVEEQVCLDGAQSNGQKTCIADSESCVRSSVHAFKHHGYKIDDEVSTIVRLLDLKPSQLGAGAGEGAADESDLELNSEHREVARKLRYIVLDNMLKNCGDEDCSKLYPVKASEVHAHACFFQHLRFWYWLPYLKLEGLLLERGIKIEQKVKLDEQSLYKFPDCKAPPAHGDPTLEWLSRVSTDGWRPVPDLVDEVTTLVASCGGKHDTLEEVSATLAHHVEHTGSWLGLLLAGLWCGGFARGGCCVRCFAAAVQAAPPRYRDIPLLSLVAVLHLQDRVKDAKHAAYLALPLAPKNKLHLFVAGISHTYVGEYEAAIRLFRMSLKQEPTYSVARACLQATMCLVLYIDDLAEAHT